MSYVTSGKRKRTNPEITKDDTTTQSQRLAQHNASRKGITSEDLRHLERMNENAMERAIAESQRDHQAERAHMERLNQEYEQKNRLRGEIVDFLGLNTKSYGELFLLREKLYGLAGELFDDGAPASSSAAGGLKF